MSPIELAALELRLADLKELATREANLAGSLLAASSAHDPEPKLQIRVIRFLAKRGVSVNETDKNGVTPLHRAVRFRSVAAARELLALGADVNQVDRRSGSTPLHRAVTTSGAPATAGKQDEALALVTLFLEHGADPGIRNKDGQTALDGARNPAIRAALGGSPA